ncbi:MAG: hypothetical protein APR63_01305 [Desulfuromonas sp. SDB]|nr:MAG: hypothetical protein APR63_01305 [Desulfuromonas sp. SDB]
MKRRRGKFFEQQCVQCGSMDIKKIKHNRFKCQHCGCIYQFVVPKIFIEKGAEVHFGKNVSMKGGLEIQSGAKVYFHDQVEIFEEGDEQYDQDGN